MAGALDKIFAEVAGFTKEMGKLHNDFLSLVERDIARYLEQSQDLSQQMNWQGWTVLGLAVSSGVLGIAGAALPKAGPDAAPANFRLAANDGITDPVTDAIRAIGNKLSDTEFLKEACKSSSQFFTSVGPVADSWFRSTTTEIESKRSLLDRINIQDGQNKKSMFDQQAQLAQSAVQRILEAKQKGG